ncbi:hypothetical protein K8Z61_01045 [Nocardioides sp. TRM66260-LWL]|uniref:hypothetical protein n=1 Tax=Nocardioides sp. TRM66260-LWL TaxID=2874478 RepID=UPI001CC62ED4|nr:hypothetical protein [Nocardioides sp. TRM66260-LWL]MBZ5733069.1 hypothetical protein [Nocardioides sp. TRM66260-LWL]
MTHARLPRLLAAVVTAAGLLGPAAVVASARPASAATCSDAGGISVVVEANELGSTSTACVAASGSTSATALFAAAGHQLTYAQQDPGFVCRVDAAPASDPCREASPASAYWSLWWSDGTRGTWVYSTLGVRSLKVPAGGSLAFVWDQRSGTVRPSTAAPVQAAKPAASPTPTRGSGGSGGSATSGSSGSGSATSGSSGSGGSRPSTSNGSAAGASGSGGTGSTPGSRPGRAAATAPPGASASASRPATASPSARPSEGAPSSPGSPGSPAGATPGSPDATITAVPTEEQADAASSVGGDDASGGLPVWIAPVLLVVAALVGGVVTLRRRAGAGR